MRPATVMSNPISQTFHHAKTRSFTPGLTRFSSSRKHARNASQLDSYIAPLAGIRYSQFPPKERERVEVTGHMDALKKIFNSFREDYDKTDKKLEALNSQFSQYSTIEEICEIRTARQEGKIKALKKKTEETKRLQIEETFNQQVNHHVLERMRQTKIHMEFKKNSIKEQIKVLNYYLKDEQRKQLMSRDGQFRGIYAFKNLQQSVIDEQKAHNLQLDAIEKEYKYTKKANNKREDRKHRQEEIAEAAANEDRDQRYNKTREALMLNKAWYKLLGNALKIQMEKSKSIEEAFQKIRVVTGLYDIQEVVQRFLTREQSYAQLTTMVTECKAICNNYKNKNTELSDMIHEFKLAEQSNKNLSTENLKNKISDCYESLTKEKDKYFRSKKTKTNILLWAKKMLVKFNKSHTDQKNENIKEVMQSLANEVKFAIHKTKELGISLNVGQKENLTEIQGIFKRLKPEQQVKMMRIDPEEILKKEASVDDLAPASFSPEILEEFPDKKYKLHPFVPEKDNPSSFRHSKYEKHK